jgi:hypothetical protein
MSVFRMFYAERFGVGDEPYIAERGVFTSLEEFAPYRLAGWTGAPETNRAVDEWIAGNTEQQKKDQA